MSRSSKTVRLSTKHIEFLRNARFLPAPLMQIVEASRSLGGETSTLLISQDIAERFRAAFTDRLAQVGFGPDYSPTFEGRLLEELIDRFNPGESS